MKTRIKSLFIAAALSLAGASIAFGQGTAFNYQGRLNTGDSPANGLYDLQFTIFDLAGSGSTVGGPLTNSAVGVTNGLFAVTLDFGGGVFTGPGRWLEIGVRSNGSGGFSTLSPRQQLTPVPYAITASNLSGTLPATQLTGTLSSTQLGGNYADPVTFNNAANSFTGNGAGLTGVNAATLAGLNSTAFWQIGGNAGTTAGVNFLGTTDNQPLELKVNGQRALRLEPTSGSPNIIGGSSNNAVNSTSGSVIGGGDSNSIVFAPFATIGGGLYNSIFDDSHGSTISGGVYNGMGVSSYSAIGGGQSNFISGDSSVSVISGGGSNTVARYCLGSFIGGGDNNSIQSIGFSVPFQVIVGGLANKIIATRNAFIGGGEYNTISGRVPPFLGPLRETRVKRISVVFRILCHSHILYYESLGSTVRNMLLIDRFDSCFSPSPIMPANAECPHLCFGFQTNNNVKGFWIVSEANVRFRRVRIV